MPKLPPENQLAPSHDLGGEPTDEDVPTPELDDYDSDPEPDMKEMDLETVAIPEEEDENVEEELGGDE